MIQALLAVAASKIIVDERTKAPSLIDVYEGISVQSFPIIFRDLGFYFLLKREANDPVTIEAQFLCGVDGNVSFNGPISVEFGDQLQTRVVINIEGFPVPNAGEVRGRLMGAAEEEYGAAAFSISQAAR